MDKRCASLIAATSYNDVIQVMNSIDKELYNSLNIEQNNAFHKYDVRSHIAYTVLNTEADLELRMAAVLHDIGKRDALTTDENGKNHFYGHEDISEKLAVDTLAGFDITDEEKRNILSLVKYHDYYNRETPKISRVRKIVSLLGDSTAKKWIKLKFADMMAQSDHSIQVKSKNLQLTSKMIDDVIKDGTAIRREDLDIRPEDGIDNEDIIQILLKSCWGNPKTNKRESLLSIAKNYSKHK